jgi:hypothetical protein
MELSRVCAGLPHILRRAVRLFGGTSDPRQAGLPNAARGEVIEDRLRSRAAWSIASVYSGDSQPFFAREPARKFLISQGAKKGDRKKVTVTDQRALHFRHDC